MIKAEVMQEFEVANFYPIFSQKLKSLDSSFLFTKNHQIRHPGGIFNICFNDILSSIKELILSLNSNKNSKELHSLTKMVLWDLNKLFESGYEIFLAFCNQGDSPKPKQPIHGWLKDKKYTFVDDYYKNLKSEKEHYLDIYNSLKHSSNRLRNIAFSEESGRQIIGFYVEGPNCNGAIGPLDKLHPVHDGKYTAISYNKFLMDVYYLVYKISYEMEDILIKSSNISQDNNLDTSNNNDSIAKEVFIMMEEVLKEAILFPNEDENQWYFIYNSENNKISFNKRAFPKIKNGWRILFSTNGDGYSKSFIHPYIDSNENSIGP